MPGISGRSQATISPKFSNRISDLKAAALQQYNAFRGTGFRRWELPPELLTDLFDLANLHVPAHDRSDINAQFEQVMSSVEDAGTVGDVIALSHQVDWLAGEERALRARHSSVCRELAHSSGRDYGVANSLALDMIQTQVQNMINVGGSS